MTISESQLETWSNPGALVSSKTTADEISEKVKSIPALRGRDVKVYLQGSYRNTTNIRGNSDVDVVVELRDCWNSDLSGMDEYERKWYTEHYPAAAYGFWDFRRDVVAGLKAVYGDYVVSPEPKCIKVAGKGSRLNADVVVCGLSIRAALGPFSSFLNGVIPLT